jgi:NAD(P)-dependent dehydrogenase (short-subunit alcohol dehydrogenase family)
VQVDSTFAANTPSYLVVGATGGIGFEVCRLLVASGARVMMAARDESKLAILADQLDCKFFVLDARQFEQVDNCVKAAVEEFGRLDGLVNCVGSLLLKPAHLTSEDDFADVLLTNLKTAFACVRAGARVMRENGGSLVLTSSAAARIGLANHEAIASAKAGIVGLTLSAAATYARQKIRVNCVAPGLVQTDLTKSVTSNELSRNASLALHPMGRLGLANDVASAIVWLLGEQSAWITGQVLAVDGGLSALKLQSAPQKLGEQSQDSAQGLAAKAHSVSSNK